MTEQQTQEPKKEYYPEILKEKGFAWRVGVTIFMVFAWLAFLIIFLFFYAGDYGVFQDIAILLVSIIIGLGVLAGLWASWGIRYASRHRMDHEVDWRMRNRPTAIVSAITFIGWLVFLIVWLFYYADKYSGYQNLAVFILSIMIACAISGSVWLVHWMRSWKRPA